MGKFISMKKIESMEPCELMKVAKKYYRITLRSQMTEFKDRLEMEEVVKEIRDRRSKERKFFITIFLIIVGIVFTAYSIFFR